MKNCVVTQFFATDQLDLSQSTGRWICVQSDRMLWTNGALDSHGVACIDRTAPDAAEIFSSVIQVNTCRHVLTWTRYARVYLVTDGKTIVIYNCAHITPIWLGGIIRRSKTHFMSKIFQQLTMRDRIMNNKTYTRMAHNRAHTTSVKAADVT